jgi:hypothetical protein
MPAEPPRPTDAELEIFSQLWITGPTTVRHIHEELSRQRPWQYSTVLKFANHDRRSWCAGTRASAHVYKLLKPENGHRASLPATCWTAFSGSARRADGAVGAEGEQANWRRFAVLDQHSKEKPRACLTSA